MASLKKSHASSGSSHSKAAKFKRYLPLYLMFLPGAIYLLINNYIPMAGIIVASMPVWESGRARSADWRTLNFCLHHRMHGLLQEIRYFTIWRLLF